MDCKRGKVDGEKGMRGIGRWGGGVPVVWLVGVGSSVIAVDGGRALSSRRGGVGLGGVRRLLLLGMAGLGVG